jgi:hypothetical protein
MLLKNSFEGFWKSKKTIMRIVSFGQMFERVTFRIRKLNLYLLKATFAEFIKGVVNSLFISLWLFKEKSVCVMGDLASPSKNLAASVNSTFI